MIRDFTEISMFKGRTNKPENKIHRVKILGNESRNGRFYHNTALESVVNLIKENPTKAFVDHDYSGNGHSVLNLLGEFTHPVKENNAVYCDLTVYESSKGKDMLYDIAEHHPHSAGFSVNCRGIFREELDNQGREVVERIVALRSVDFVSEPATVNGIFEQRDEELQQLREKIISLERTNKYLIKKSKVSRIPEAMASVSGYTKERFWDDLNRNL